MKESDFIGKKVVNVLDGGGVYSVISCRKTGIDNKDFLIVLNDGKNGYSVRLSLTKKTIKFEDCEFQREVENYLNEKTVLPPSNPIDVVLAKAVELYYGNGGKRDICNMWGAVNNGLVGGTIYGTCAYDIYENCCRNLGFDYLQKGKFASQKGLYAPYATKEKYGVWFLPHSNLTGDATSRWANVVDGDIIYEVWFENDDVKDKCDRVVFLKQGCGEYVFMGIYTLEKVEVINKYVADVYITVKKTYKKIYNVYP